MKTFGRSSTHYALTNHLGNVMAVIFDAPGGGTQPTVESLTDYYPFGMAMPGRKYERKSGEDYRYGFQGQDKEKELWGGESSFFKYRISDNRLGRFFSVDPLSSKFPWNSSYAFSENRVIDGVELEGLEVYLLPGSNGNARDVRSAYKLLKQSVKGYLKLSISPGGKLSAEILPGKDNFYANKLYFAINSPCIMLQIKCEHIQKVQFDLDLPKREDNRENRSLVNGGAFGGNYAINSPSSTDSGRDKFVVAYQYVQPDVLRKMGMVSKNCGDVLLHEILEAYDGAIMTLGSALKVVPPAIGKKEDNPIYSKAHDMNEELQSMDLTFIRYNKDGVREDEFKDRRNNFLLKFKIDIGEFVSDHVRVVATDKKNGNSVEVQYIDDKSLNER